MSSGESTTQMLIILLIGAIILVFVLSIVYIVLKIKENANRNNKKKEKNINTNVKGSKTEDDKILKRQSVYDFMEFDKIEDNMIIQENGKRYVMVIECQGVNYDLMSEVEKTGVEEGFVQFLNTLRHPIQIYVQTRTVNLGNSIEGYKKNVKELELNLMKLNQEYNMMNEAGTYSKEEIDKVFFEITKLSNLYEYGKDIIYDTEKMSLNKNILNKKYYIILYYHISELGKNELDKSELQAVSFSELYTRAQSIVRGIAPCGINAKILNSMELAELLYVAYNRDESEVFELKQAIRSEYDRLYSTSQDVLEKKMMALDKEIQDKAMQKITEKVEKFKSKYREDVEEKEQSIDELADEMAKIILEENKNYLGREVVDAILKDEEKGEKGNEDKQTRKRARNTRTKTK